MHDSMHMEYAILAGLGGNYWLGADMCILANAVIGEGTH